MDSRSGGSGVPGDITSAGGESVTYTSVPSSDGDLPRSRVDRRGENASAEVDEIAQLGLAQFELEHLREPGRDILHATNVGGHAENPAGQARGKRRVPHAASSPA